MQFAFTSDQLMLRDSARSILQAECTPERVRAVWSSGRLDSRLWQTLGENGLVGLLVPEESGGLGMAFIDLVLLLEETGRVALPAPFVETAAVVAPMLAAFSGDSRASEWLSKIASGEATATVCTDHHPHVAYASTADVIVAQVGESLHLLEKGDFDCRQLQSVDHARQLSALIWEASPETRLAHGPEAVSALSAAFNRAALAAAAQLVGVARHMIDMTVEYATVRQQFGKPIGTFQAVQHRLADTLVKLEFARPCVYRAANSITHQDEAMDVHVSMAKSMASDSALQAAKTALQVHGAIGYTFEYDLQMWMKRAWALASAWGDAAWHRDRVGRAIL